MLKPRSHSRDPLHHYQSVGNRLYVTALRCQAGFLKAECPRQLALSTITQRALMTSIDLRRAEERLDHISRRLWWYRLRYHDP